MALSIIPPIVLGGILLGFIMLAKTLSSKNGRHYIILQPKGGPRTYFDGPYSDVEEAVREFAYKAPSGYRSILYRRNWRFGAKKMIMDTIISPVDEWHKEYERMKKDEASEIVV